MTENVFQAVKDRVSAREAAERYGITLNRAGFAQCPFHDEKTPSMKLYSGNSGFHCFGCGAGGSVIDFTAQLFGLDAIGAVRRLNEDFSLGLPIDRQPTEEDRREARHRAEIAATRRAFDQWRRETINRLNACFRVAHLLDKPPDDMTEAEIQAVKWQLAIEEWADCLMSDNLEDQMKIFRDRNGVAAVCQTILNDMPAKSGAA